MEEAIVSWLLKLKGPPAVLIHISSTTSSSLTKGWVVRGEAHVHWLYHFSEGMWDGRGGLSEKNISLTLEIQRMKPKAVISASNFNIDIVGVLEGEEGEW